MASYIISRGIDKPIEFQGFKGRYIIYAGMLLVGDILLFAILYICRVDSWICVIISFGLGVGGVSQVYKRSVKYGEFGWAKRRAGRLVPSAIRCQSRRTFTQLKKEDAKTNRRAVPHPRSQQ